MKLVITREEVLNCAIGEWYHTFAQTPRCTIRTEFVELPPDFIKYLNEDSVILPSRSKEKLHACDPRSSKPLTKDGHLDELYAYGDTWQQEEEEDEKIDAPSFESLEDAIQQAIAKLDGEVFPKLNWSSPQDAAWLFGSLKCRSSGEVVLLLKSSDFAQHDLHRAFDHTQVKYSDGEGTGDEEPAALHVPLLSLRKWSSLNPAMEFRCVVYDRAVVAICQRDTRSYFAFLNENNTRQKIESCILDDLFQNRVKDSFPNDCYTLDVYIDTQDRPWIVDFNPLARFDSISVERKSEICWDDSKSRTIAETPPHGLLSWETLLEQVRNKEGPLFLVVESEKDARTSGNVLSAHRVPLEVVNGTLNAAECAKLDEIFRRDLADS